MKKLPPFHTLDKKEFSTLSNKIYDIFIIQFQNDTEIQYDDGIVIARGLKIALQVACKLVNNGLIDVPL